MNPSKLILTVGDRAPNFALPDSLGKLRSFYDLVKGQYILLYFIQSNNSDAEIKAKYFFDHQEKFYQKAHIIIVTSPEVITKFANTINTNSDIKLLSDPLGKISKAYFEAVVDLSSQKNHGEKNHGQKNLGLLLDPNQRILQIYEENSEIWDIILSKIDTLNKNFSSHILSNFAPVLMLPRVLDFNTCQSLIERWNKETIEEGKVLSVIDGQAVERVHYDLKKNRYQPIKEPDLIQKLSFTIGRRIAPELQKVFRFQGFYFDQFHLTCYNAERGDYFKPHRDDASEETSDRVFAMSLNLNDDFVGGNLYFPEYGFNDYRPEAGSALIFSTTILHEAKPLLQGERFVLLSFLRKLNPSHIKKDK
ncbi:MAG: 2OG-Fe(II) oxygenase [Alphaproteobacteria bacterium]|nr:2OG-Fe(II) oxygenase [Alphaproteobacteria bacterium]